MTKRRLTVIGGLVAVVALVGLGAVGVVCMYRSLIAHNEAAAVKTLRTLIVQEVVWHKQDVDGNGTNDYWSIDIAGLYRVLRQPEGVEAAMIDIAVARSDWSPDGAGNGGGGEFPIVAVPYVPGKHVPGLAAMSHRKPESNSGYYLATFSHDPADTPYSGDFARDTDGAGQAYENIHRFAFLAFPEEYGGTGKNAFLASDNGIICRRDAVEGEYLSRDGDIPTVPGVAPVKNWPSELAPRKQKCPDCG
ncbi:MAG: hypothetical protein RDV41_13900, partial [Planctomycetota bacterium]|nr:hypothetical protein [Planctomycetota bacterium]